MTDGSSRPPLVPLPPPTDFSNGVGPLEVVEALLKRWRVVAGLPLIAAVLAAAISFVLDPLYTATATFVPESRSQTRVPPSLAGLAGQFGITLASEPAQSPRFYAEVVKSRELLERVLGSVYADPRGTNPADSVTLLELLHVTGRTPADSLQNALESFETLVSTRVDNLTNIVRLNVSNRYPSLAADVANRFVTLLNEFNSKNRQSQARARRQFIEQRLEDAARELSRAEDALKAFHGENRGWQQSPQNVVQEARVHRQMDIQREIYLTLRREYETARIEEVNDTPVITVIDAAIAPNQPTRPNRPMMILTAVLLGGCVGVLWALGGAYVDHLSRQARPRYQAFRVLLHDTRREIRQTLGLPGPR